MALRPELSPKMHQRRTRKNPIRSKPKNVSAAAFVWIPVNLKPCRSFNPRAGFLTEEVWNMLKFKINDQEVEAQPEWTVLDTAREYGIQIPTLCYHEAVGPSGACRLCVVEVVEGNWSKVVISCMYPVKEGITVLTDSDRVKNVRRWILEMLLAECPASKEIQGSGRRIWSNAFPFFHQKPGRTVYALRIVCPGLQGGSRGVGASQRSAGGSTRSSEPLSGNPRRPVWPAVPVSRFAPPGPCRPG